MSGWRASDHDAERVGVGGGASSTCFLGRVNGEERMTIPISSIKIGQRHRHDLGDLAGLAASIEELGLLQPIGITGDNELVFGERRMRACRDVLGWEEIDADRRCRRNRRRRGCRGARAQP